MPTVLTVFGGGTVHKEIFEFERIMTGPYKGKEWDAIVRKVVNEWGEFVSRHI